MKRYSPSLFDRLVNDRGYGAADGTVTQLSLEQLKDSVVRDLEDLLNTRTVLPAAVLAAYPEAAGTVLNYGLIDFSGYCLSSDIDRKSICTSLQAAIERHEPRLRAVRATLEVNADAKNRLNFVIAATLHVSSAVEPVNFNAVLQPSTLHYSISQM